MAVLWLESWDLCSVGHVASRYDNASVGGGAVIGTGQGRTGKGYGIRNGTDYFLKNTGTQSTVVAGFWFRPNTLTGGSFSTSNPIFAVWDGGTIQCWLGIDDTTGVLKAFRGAGESNLLGTSAAALSLGVGYAVEFLVTPHNTTGVCTVKVNGSTVISASGNTRGSGANQATAARLGWQGDALIATEDNSDWDDWYVAAESHGDLLIVPRMADGAGSSAQWTPTAGANWQCVDESPANDATDYVASSTVGHRDLYAMAAYGVAGATVIHAVQESVRAQKSDAGARTMSLVLKSGATTDVATAAALGTSFGYFTKTHPLNPNGSVAWTEAAVDALEAGQEVAA